MRESYAAVLREVADEITHVRSLDMVPVFPCRAEARLREIADLLERVTPEALRDLDRCIDMARATYCANTCVAALSAIARGPSREDASDA